MTSEITLKLLIIAGLVLVNAFFVMAEYALVRLRRTRIEELASQGNASAKAVKEALEHINLLHLHLADRHHRRQPGPGLDRRTVPGARD